MSFIFGEIRYIDPYITGIALFVTIIFLGLCEYFTITLEEYLKHSSVYLNMLQKIYRELMIIGKKTQTERNHAQARARKRNSAQERERELSDLFLKN